MISTDNLIIPEKTVRQIIKRFAFEIYENHYGEDEIFLVGVFEKGYQMAGLIQDQLKEISDFSKIEVVKLEVDKENPLSSEVCFDVDIDTLSGKAVVLIDDVLNSGRTMAHCLKALMETDIKKVETVVLVDRSHKRFPVLANYKGYELSTTLEEHVEVKLDSEFGVYLY